ncbi:DUF6011 domain-containing protein [Gordonia sp. VNK1]|uniref:DUF6011 domain-containing protein n=1 Tax=Gordonia oleivorans TaxID=3156618 RepID=UPI0032B54BD9
MKPAPATEPGRGGDPHGGRITAESISDIDLDTYLDPADRLMLAALREGTYILAVRCLVCGAPLTARRSRALGVGPACRRKAVADA